jgi:anti-sigma factor RsiW
MTTHLNDDQIAAAVAGLELDRETERHLNGCVTCRREVAEFGDTVGARRAEMLEDAPDWKAQRAAVLDRLPAAPRIGQPHWWSGRSRALALAAAVACVIGLAALWPRETDSPRQVAGDLPVAQILEESEALLEDGNIPGFEPIQWSSSELGLATAAPTPDTSS